MFTLEQTTHSDTKIRVVNDSSLRYAWLGQGFVRLAGVMYGWLGFCLVGLGWLERAWIRLGLAWLS